ncbi:hypothetical protein ACFHWD_03960 [Clostridium sp. MT-14]|uniref:hypothetical protein n=1 Tax=Clostridium sp. MT-14 TaxID=3348360 RepID=UPI0035F47BBE
MTSFLSNFNDDFDEMVEGIFGKPRHLIFNSSVKDLYPTNWKKNENGDYICTIKTLGIEPSDLNIEQTEWGLKVQGETKIEEDTYNTSMELPIANGIMNKINKIKVKSRNGLTFITLILDKEPKKKIEIETE